MERSHREVTEKSAAITVSEDMFFGMTFNVDAQCRQLTVLKQYTVKVSACRENCSVILRRKTLKFISEIGKYLIPVVGISSVPLNLSVELSIQCEPYT